MKKLVLITSLVMHAGITLLSQSHAVEISEVPVFAIGGVEPNVMMVLDDSGSMQFETILPTNDGILRWDRDKERFQENGELLFSPSSAFNYFYAFRSSTKLSNVVPPIDSLAFIRSADFNKAYYDNNITYEPWPTFGDYKLPNGDTTFPLAKATEAKYSPFDTEIRDLTNASTSEEFLFQSGMVCNNTGDVVASSGSDVKCGSETLAAQRNGAGLRTVTYNPAVYYLKVTGDAFSFRDRAGVKRQCKDDNLSYSNTNDLYHFASRNPDIVLTDSIDSIAPDGSCLEEVVIKSGDTYPYQQTLEDGSLVSKSRSFNEELQNFANWFTYHRNRNFSLKAGLAEGFRSQQTKKFNIGMFTINNALKFDTMESFNENRASFLDDLYNVPASGTTPLRSALLRAGELYSQTGNDKIITHSCQANYTILFTDGFNADKSISASSDVVNADQNQGEPFEDNAPGTLADVAFYFYNNLHKVFSDDKSLQGDNVKGDVNCGTDQEKPWDDCNEKLHMTTYTFGLNAKGTLYDPDDATRNSTEAAHTFASEFAWPEKDINVQRNAEQIDDLWHAAVNGKGEIVNAKSTSDIETGIREILNDFLDGEATNSGIDVSDIGVGRNADRNRLIFKGKMNLATASGDVEAFLINIAGVIGANARWSAEDKLNNRTSSRRIFTYGNGDVGTRFRWADLKASQKLDLRTSPTGSLDSAAVGKQRLNYIKGDRTQEGEGGDFRVRSSLIGDIASSTPIFSGAPLLNISDFDPFGAENDRYSAYKEAQANRAGTVFVGANDGMLHAFEASTGEELFAYIPGLVYSSEIDAGLHYLTDKNYERRSYVDLSPTIFDAYIATPNDSSRKWRTLLVGGLRTGGPGIFALDVTDPQGLATKGQAKAAKELVMWEFVDDNMGIMLQKPFVTMTNTGKWAVIFSNGYSANGEAEIEGYLYIVYLEKESGQIKFKAIPTGAKAGLSAATLADVDGNGTTDKVYAGDLKGNLWSFDISSNDDNDWDKRKLFKAKSANGVNQPITAAVSVAANPYVATNTDGSVPVIVAFGTGKYLAEADISNEDQQSFYVVGDNGKINRRADLEKQSFVSSADTREITGKTPDFVNTQGWYVDFPIDGERTILQPEIFDDDVSFFSSKPSTDPCILGGESWFTTVQLNGKAVDENPFSNLSQFGDGRTASINIGEFVVVSSQSLVIIDDGNGARVTVGRGNTLEDFRAVRNLDFDVEGERTAWEELINE